MLGALQGIAINYEFFTKRQRLQFASRFNPYWVKFFSRLMVFIFFGFTLIFFNASSPADAFYFMSHIFSGIEWQVVGHGLGLTRIEYFIVFTGILTVLYVDYLNEKGILIREAVSTRPVIKWGIYYGLVLSVLILGKTSGPEFIYFQF